MPRQDSRKDLHPSPRCSAALRGVATRIAAATLCLTATLSGSSGCLESQVDAAFRTRAPLSESDSAKRVKACPRGFGDCDRNPKNGCETQLEPWETECSLCEPACGDGLVCRAGVCRDADPAVKIAAGGDHSCALRRSGAVVCWGDNSRGQLGDGTTIGRARPVRVSNIIDAVDLATGDQHSCAVRASGAVTCWGDNTSRQVGHDSGAESPLPAPVAGVRDAVQVTAGRVHTCALLANGKATCWGSSESGQLGDGNVDQRCMPPVVVQSTGMQFVQVSAAATHTCALNRQGQVACWGRNDRGQIGDATSSAHRASPVPLRGLTQVTQVAAGESHGCAVRVKGDVFCWGSSEGAGKDSGKPAPLKGLTDVVQLGAGSHHSCARTNEGEVWCWGSNDQGQLGIGDQPRQKTPARVGLIDDAASIAIGKRHGCALRENHDIVCWGDNAKGQLGDGTRVKRGVPVTVVGLQ